MQVTSYKLKIKRVAWHRGFIGFEKTNAMRNLMMCGMLATGMFIASCSENPSTMPDTESSAMRSDAGSISTSPWNPAASNVMNLYYNGDMVSAFYRLNVMTGAPMQHQTDNVIYSYMVDSVFDANHELHTFIPVTNAYDQAGKKLWRETLIIFNRGFEAHQFTDASAIQSAAVGSNPEVTLVPGTRMFLIEPVATH